MDVACISVWLPVWWIHVHETGRKTELIWVGAEGEHGPILL